MTLRVEEEKTDQTGVLLLSHLQLWRDLALEAARAVEARKVGEPQNEVADAKLLARSADHEDGRLGWTRLGKRAIDAEVLALEAGRTLAPDGPQNLDSVFKLFHPDLGRWIRVSVHPILAFHPARANPEDY